MKHQVVTLANYVIHSYNGILCISEQKGMRAVGVNMDDCHKHEIEQGKQSNRLVAFKVVSLMERLRR